MTGADKGHYRKATGDPMTTENNRYQPSAAALLAPERPFRPALWTRLMVLLRARSDYYLTHPMPPRPPRRWRASVSFAWYDLWVGAFWDRKRYVLYVCPLPCLLVTVAFVHPALRTPEIKAAHLAAMAEMKHHG